MKKVIVKIYKEKDSYSAITDNFPSVVIAYGNTLNEVKHDIKNAFNDTLEVAKEEGFGWVKDYENDVEFEYKMNVSHFFKLIPEINVSAFARRLNIRDSLMRKYATDENAYISEKRLLAINAEIHNLGKDLLEIRL